MSISPEQRLWQSVVYQAFVDATAESPGDQERIRAKRDADSWIRGCGRDFRMVCDMAGMDPSFLSQAYRSGRVNRDLLKAAERREQAE